MQNNGQFYSEVAQELGVRTTTINGSQYTIQLAPALTAMELSKEIMCFLFPAMSAIFDKIKSSDTMLPEEQMTFVEVAFVMVKQLKELDLTKLSRVLLANASCNGKMLDPDQHFRGKLKDLMALLQFAIKENGILDFFIEYLRDEGLEIPSLSEAAALFKAVTTKPEEPSQDSTAEEQSS